MLYKIEETVLINFPFFQKKKRGKISTIFK
jgi:hypothetical protein